MTLALVPSHFKHIPTKRIAKIILTSLAKTSLAVMGNWVKQEDSLRTTALQHWNTFPFLGDFNMDSRGLKIPSENKTEQTQAPPPQEKKVSFYSDIQK